MLTFVHGITHAVSENRIISSMVKIDNLEKRIIQYKHQGFRNPFVIIIIRSTNDVTKLIDITKNGKIKYPILLVIFTGDDGDHSCEICKKPFDKLVQLKYNMRFFVSCCNSSSVVEWLSSDDDDKILELSLVNITNEIIIWNDTSVEKKKNLQGLSIRVSAMKVKMKLIKMKIK